MSIFQQTASSRLIDFYAAASCNNRAGLCRSITSVNRYEHIVAILLLLDVDEASIQNVCNGCFTSPRLRERRKHNGVHLGLSSLAFGGHRGNDDQSRQ